MRIGIIGAAGTGKSTLAKNLAAHLGSVVIPDHVQIVLREQGRDSWKGVSDPKQRRKIREDALRRRMVELGAPGVQVTVVDYDLTGHHTVMRQILANTDILVDATQRPDPSRVVIPNDWLDDMPQHAVLVDLSVDPCDCTVDPPKVKGIEGIPQGNLDQYIFWPDDPAWDHGMPCLSARHRRTVVSCYSWPGLHPKACMEVYGHQMRPIMRALISHGGLAGIDPHGRFFERAIARAQLSRWTS